MIKLAIVGSRGFDNYSDLELAVKNHFCGYDHEHDVFDPYFNEIISGGAAGADKMAETIAEHLGVKMTVFKPDWEKYGKRAGFLRNEDIIKASTHVLACWDGISRGTGNSLGIAKRLKKPTFILYF